MGIAKFEMWWLIEALRILIGLIFILSGLFKMSDIVLFEEAIVEFNILPQYSRLFAIIIPSFELVAGVSLLIGIFKKAAIVIMIFLLFSFTFAIGINLAHGFKFDCGCFGPFDLLSKISIEKLFFNFIIVFCLFLIFLNDKQKVDILNQLKILFTYGFFVVVLIYIPYSNYYWAYTIDKRNIVDIDWETAIRLVKNNNAFLFDVRSQEQYEKEHVTGALSLPLKEFGKHLKKYRKLLSKESFIIVYCDGYDCYTATRAALRFVARGYKNIFRVTGGLDAWKAKH